jgi:hypothetical protein
VGDPYEDGEIAPQHLLHSWVPHLDVVARVEIASKVSKHCIA